MLKAQPAFGYKDIPCEFVRNWIDGPDKLC